MKSKPKPSLQKSDILCPPRVNYRRFTTGAKPQGKRTTLPEAARNQGIKILPHLAKSPISLHKVMAPISNPPRGIICGIHGYGIDTSRNSQSTVIFHGQKDFACFAVDTEGHGRTEGIRGYVPNIGFVVQDSLSFFNSTKQDPKFHGLRCFLYGKSMGAAICLLIHLDDPNGFDGAILVAPMRKISDKVQIVTFIARFLPILAIIPVAAIVQKSIKVEEKRIIRDMNPVRYRGRPRSGTAFELQRVTEYLGKRLSDVSIPVLVVHGSEDTVTDPEVSIN
ncbi:hypothetical protein SLE2022_013110 [Rubroshorea leprosula]